MFQKAGKDDFNFDIAPEVLSALLVGSVVNVFKFPLHHEIPGVETKMVEPPGFYFVDSVIIDASRNIQVGIAHLDTREHIDYFSHNDIDLRIVSKGIYWLSGPRR